MARSAKLRAWPVALLCFGVYAATFSYRPSTDAHLNVIQTRALVLHGDIDLTRYGDQAGYTVQRGSRLYSLYGIGISLLAAPFYLVLSHAGASVLAHHAIPSIAFASLAAAALFVLLRRRFEPAIAIGGTILFAFGTTMWPTATTAFWAHAPVALLVALALGAFLSDGERAPAWAGLAFGSAAFVRPSLALLGLAAGLAYATRGWTDLRRYAAGAAGPLVLALAVNEWLWGSPFRTGYSFFDVGFGGDVVRGLTGELFSWRRGLFVYTPAFALSIAGGVIAALRARAWFERRIAALAGGTVALMVLYASFTVWWGGDEQYGYRYLLDAAPALTVLAAYAVTRVRALRVPAAALTALSIGIMALGSQPNRLGWDVHVPTAGLGASPLGAAWDACLAGPGPVAARLAAVALVAAALAWVLRRGEAV